MSGITIFVCLCVSVLTYFMAMKLYFDRSIKSNLGHTEGASSLIAIVKALIALDSGIIPPNINYESPNNKIEALKKEKMKVKFI